MHHQALGAVKVGSCLEPSERRIADHIRRGWKLLVVIGAPTGWDAAEIERCAVQAFTPFIYRSSDMLVTVLPGHAVFEVRSELDTRRSPLRHGPGGFLRPDQMPQGGAGETFDVCEVSPERVTLALWYIEANHRARYYPPSGDGADTEQRHRARVEARARNGRVVH